MGDNAAFKITVLGARGSVPISGERFLQYGGNSSCYLVEAGEEKIFIDAGTGIIHAPYFKDEHISVLLSHLHIDHLMGLPFFKPLFDKGRVVDAYCVTREGKEMKDHLDSLFVPPFWPCRLDEYVADVHYHEAVFPFEIGDVKVDGIEGSHPGGCTIYSLCRTGKKLVYMSDFEHDPEGFSDELISFASGADAIFYDAQYTEDEYEAHKGYGHSTSKKGLEFLEKTGAKKLYMIHHSPGHDDEFLKNEEEKLASEDVRFAKEDEVILL